MKCRPSISLFLMPLFFSLACHNSKSEVRADEIASAQSKTRSLLAAAELGRKAGELLGLVPVYTCGESRSGFSNKLIQQLEITYSGSTVASEENESGVIIAVQLPESGSAIENITIKGKLVFTISRGESRFDIQVDLRNALLDGKQIDAVAGYGVCGDETKWWISSKSNVDANGTIASIDSVVRLRDGIPFFGESTLIIDGKSEVRERDCQSRATFDGLELELGSFLPKQGTVSIETCDGSKISATFKQTLWRLGVAEIAINDSEAVIVPIIR